MIALLGDTHFGVRSDSKEFNAFYKKFYTNIFFPYLKENNIKTVYQLGDLFDRRKYVNFFTLSECREYFFDVLQDNGIDFHVLLGNHDIFWKESLGVNSPELLLKDYKNITVYNSPTTVGDIDFIPWICEENEKDILNFIKKSKSKYCMGHYEIQGFEMSKGVEGTQGVSPSIFKNYTQVFSGHYHTRSYKGNIMYAGTPMEHTWADCDDPRGFHIWNPENNDIKFVENPYTIHCKHFYDESKKVTDYSIFTEKYVKVIIENKKDFAKFDKFIEEVYNHNPLEVKVMEDMIEFNNRNDNITNVEDVFTLLTKYVDGLDTDADKEKIKLVMKDLYEKAQEVE
jgi:hypothetical protein